MGVRGQIDDKFTSTSSDDYSNDSDFIQHIVLSGHTSYASVMKTSDSDNVSEFMSIKDSCAAILDNSTYAEFDQVNQTIVRTTLWPPGDSDQDWVYFHKYRSLVDQLNPLGTFRQVQYTRDTIRLGTNVDSAGNNWGN